MTGKKWDPLKEKQQKQYKSTAKKKSGRKPQQNAYYGELMII